MWRDQNLARGGMTEGDAGAVHLANDGGAAGEFGDGGRFSEAELPHALLEGSFAQEFTHPAINPNGHLAKGERCWSGILLHAGTQSRLRLSFNVNRLSAKSGQKKAHLRKVRFLK